jgi:hypothetical protein
MPEATAEYSDKVAFVILRIKPANRGTDAENVEKIGAGYHLPDDFAMRAGNPVDVAEPEVVSQILKYAGIPQFTIPVIWNIRGPTRASRSGCHALMSSRTISRTML